MVAVTYEEERGLRERHQAPAGYQLSVSRTIDAPAEGLFRAWSDDGARAGWLPHPDLTVRRSTAPRSLRLAWGDGSAVDVNIYPRGEDRSRVVVDHRRLGDAHKVALMKEFWADALDALTQATEGK
jgi:hypothetical protein